MNDDLEAFRDILDSVESNLHTPKIENKNSLRSSYVKNSKNKPTVLIIDDDLQIRESLSFILNKKYNLVLCKNGFETFIEIKEKNKYLPIIFHSAYQDLKNPMEIMNDFRPFGYVVKGREGKELLHTLESAVDYFLQISRNAILTQTYQKFVPKEFLEFLGKSDITEIQLGDQTQKEMSILFSDIRSFTELSETMNSDENFKFINSYLKRIAPQIIKNQGFIDKYIGDAVMALFPNKPENAINAAIQMLEELHIYNQNRISKNYKPISIGIGINTGILTLGIVGDKDRMEGTVISDAVNIASRMENLTKMYGASILLSEITFQKLENPTDYEFRVVDTVKVKGKKEPVTVIEILNGNSKRIIDIKLETKREFEFGTALYQQADFAEAKHCFQKVLKKDPVDKAALIYLKRSEYYEIHGIPPDWEGIEKLENK